jgi:hypothetical protein
VVWPARHRYSSGGGWRGHLLAANVSAYWPALGASFEVFLRGRSSPSAHSVTTPINNVPRAGFLARPPFVAVAPEADEESMTYAGLALAHCLTGISWAGLIRAPSGGQVAQLVEQRTENPRVGGSIPPLGTSYGRRR